MPILPKTFYRGLELVSDEKQQSYLTRGITGFFEYKKVSVCKYLYC